MAKSSVLLIVLAGFLPLLLDSKIAPKQVKRNISKRQAPIGILNPPIPTSGAHIIGGNQQIDKCPRNEVLFSDGNCYQLLTQGPCLITQYILLDPDTNKPYCAERLCAPDRIFLFSDQLCHDPRNSQLCPPGRELYETSYGTPICQCPTGTYEGDDDLDDDVCDPLLGQTLKCPPGQVFWFRDFSLPPECLNDPCGGDNLNRGPNDQPFVPFSDGRCFQLGSMPNVCPAQTWYSIALEQLQGVCTSLEDAGYEVFDQETQARLTELYGPPISRDSTAPIAASPGAAGQTLGGAGTLPSGAPGATPSGGPISGANQIVPGSVPGSGGFGSGNQGQLIQGGGPGGVSSQGSLIQGPGVVLPATGGQAVHGQGISPGIQGTFSQGTPGQGNFGQGSLINNQGNFGQGAEPSSSGTFNQGAGTFGQGSGSLTQGSLIKKPGGGSQVTSSFGHGAVPLTQGSGNFSQGGGALTQGSLIQRPHDDTSISFSPRPAHPFGGASHSGGLFVDEEFIGFRTSDTSDLHIREGRLLADIDVPAGLSPHANADVARLQAPPGHELHGFFNSVRSLVHNGPHNRSRRNTLPHASPGNVFETRLVGCRAGAQRDVNAKCRDTVLPPRTRAARPARAAPPVPPRPGCPDGQAFNIRRMCEATGSAVNSVNSFNLG